MKCPDDGTCHHECATRYKGACWRVFNAAPLTGSGWDKWPAEIEAQQYLKMWSENRVGRSWWERFRRWLRGKPYWVCPQCGKLAYRGKVKFGTECWGTWEKPHPPRLMKLCRRDPDA